MGKYKDSLRFKNFVSKTVHKKNVIFYLLLIMEMFSEYFEIKKKNGLKIKKVLDGNFQSSMLYM